jgi:hypothetical protein
MKKNEEITMKSQVVAKPSHFVMQYKDVSAFSQNYLLDSNLLGEGKIAVQFSDKLSHRQV